MSRIMKTVDILAIVGLIIALYFAFIYAPNEAVMGAVQRIFIFMFHLLG